MIKSYRRERGVALIMALLALLVLTAVGMTMMFSSDTETKVNGNYRDTQSAYFAAKAGLEEARDRIRSDVGSGAINLSGSLPTTAPGTASGVLYITNPTGSETVAPWNTSNAYYDDEICKEIPSSTGCSSSPAIPSTSGWYSSVSANSSYATSPVLPYKWARINLKVNSGAYGKSHVMTVNPSDSASYYVCWNGSNEIAQSTACTSSQAVYILTALAVAPSGSRRMVQYELAKNQITLTLPGALTIDGPIASGANTICGSGATCNSGGDWISGNEPDASAVPSHIPTACGLTNTVPGIATADATSNANLVAAINPNASNIVGSGGTPSVVNESSALTNLSTPAQIEALVSQLKAAAGSNVGSDCTKLNLGSSASPTIAVVTNDPVSSGQSGGVGCNLNSGTTGYGILVVTGSLQFVNVDSYQGIILMLGQAQFVSSSSKDTTLDGALFMAQDRDPSTGAMLSSLGTPTFNFHHGSTNKGDPSIQWNQCVINTVSSLATFTNYKILAAREMMY